MPNSVLGGARPRRATVLMLAALVAVPAAATRPSAAEAVGTGAPSQGVVLPQDPAEADLGRAVGSLDALVKTQRVEADVAAKSVAGARARLEAADTAVAEAEHRLDALVAKSGVAAPGFLGAASTERPRSEDRPRPPRSQPAPAGQPALPLPLNVDAALVERFDEARDRLVVEARKRADAEAVAKEQARRAADERAEADAATARRAEFLEDAQQRLAEELDEAAASGDRGRQAEMKARHDEVIAMIEAPARAAAARKAKAEAAANGKAEAAALRPGPIGSPTRTFPAVRCPAGGAITVDGSLAHNLNALIRSAWRDGINLCGGGYRDPRQQIRLRVQNCGSSDYAVWRKPSGSCSPPTAIPGTSMHERGLAVDFRCAGRGMPSRSGPCFGWMAAHAGAFGFFNLPSEPWHWSTSGS